MSVDPHMPDPWAPMQSAPVRDRPLRHLLLLLATIVTTTMAGARIAGVEPTSLAAFVAGLPFSVTLLAILLTHEAGHYLMCRWHGIAASLPYVLPAPPFFLLGTFGAVIRVAIGRTMRVFALRPTSHLPGASTSPPPFRRQGDLSNRSADRDRLDIAQPPDDFEVHP